MNIFESILLYTSLSVQIFIFSTGLYFFIISISGWYTKEKNNIYILKQNRFALIIPAHNEETVIGHIIDSLKNQNYPKKYFDIIVVADNCSDKTGIVAKNHGAIVINRNNENLKGKGYALEYTFNSLFKSSKRYDAICVFDADNLVSFNFLLTMNSHLCKGEEVIQGYIDSKNPFDSWITLSYSIAFWLSNRIFQQSRANLSLSCGLCGTGFCIKTNVLKKLGWGATCLTEDLEFTMKLVLNDKKVCWAKEAIVFDEKPLTLKQSWKQRKRWMQGHADCARRYFRPLFLKAISEFNFKALDCAIYLFQPIRFIFFGLATIIMWIETFCPDVPFFILKYAIPAELWAAIVIGQMIFGPFVVLVEKKFNILTLLGFVIYPFYCLTWVPISIQGLMNVNKKDWCHTKHTRNISIKDINELGGRF